MGALGDRERQQLAAAVGQPSIFYWQGRGRNQQTALFIARFRQHCPVEHVATCSSGTAAVHIAIAAAGIGPGDEVITTPITDIGTVSGILFQQAVPVFADLVAVILPKLDLASGEVQEKIGELVDVAEGMVSLPTVNDQRGISARLRQHFLVYLGLSGDDTMQFLLQLGQRIQIDEGSLKQPAKLLL